MKENNSKGRAGIVLAVVILVIIIAANVIVGSLKNDIAAYTTRGTIDTTEYSFDEIFREGQLMDVELEEGGAVLLKNDNDALPLSSGEKATALGYYAANIIYGGAGSGAGKSDEYNIDLYDAFTESGIDIEMNKSAWDWLSSGSRSWNDYSGGSQCTNYTMDVSEYSDMPISGYTDVAIVVLGRNGGEGYALPLLGCGKNGDRNYIELTEDEEDLLKWADRNFKKTIVIINSSNVMELGFLDVEEYGVDACLWIGGPGESGLVGVGNILVGNTSPSGRLADTYLYAAEYYPTAYGAFTKSYQNSEFSQGNNKNYYHYEEGIYVGYRWAETAYAEAKAAHESGASSYDITVRDFSLTQGDVVIGNGVDTKTTTYGPSYKWEQMTSSGFGGTTVVKSVSEKITSDFENSANKDYCAGYFTVDPYTDPFIQFGFGYGLSYTSFEQEIVSSDISLRNGAENSVTVKVTNTGDVTGRSVVELYMEAPYGTDPNLGIEGSYLEKSAEELIAYGKTKELRPGASEEITLYFGTDELASYDYAGQQCYALEKGTYTFTVKADSHNESIDGYYDMVNNKVEVSLANTLLYKDSDNYNIGAECVGKRSTDMQVATNALDDVTAGDGLYDGYLSRADFNAGMQAIVALPVDGVETITDPDYIKILQSEDSSHPENTISIDVYRNGQLTSKDFTYYYYAHNATPYQTTNYLGEDMNDPKYDYYLNITGGNWEKDNGLTVDDVTGLDYDDPLWDDLMEEVSLQEMLVIQSQQGWSNPQVASVGVRAGLVLDGPCEAGNGNYNGCTWFTVPVVVASTFDTELALRMGEAYGHQAKYCGLTFCYAPAMDVHRSPFGGRNFEYYSEDGYLGGTMGAAIGSGIMKQGVGVFNKHMGLNDESGGGASVFANEQAVREVYQKAFEFSAKYSTILYTDTDFFTQKGAYTTNRTNEPKSSGIMGALCSTGFSFSHVGLWRTMLRDEYGYKGFCITDGGGGDGARFSSGACIIGGEEAILGTASSLNSSSIVAVDGDATETAYGLKCLYDCAKHYIFMYANTSGGAGVSWGWVAWWVIADVVLVAAFVLVIVFMVYPGMIKPAVRKRKANGGAGGDAERKG